MFTNLGAAQLKLPNQCHYYPNNNLLAYCNTNETNDLHAEVPNDRMVGPIGKEHYCYAYDNRLTGKRAYVRAFVRVASSFLIKLSKLDKVTEQMKMSSKDGHAMVEIDYEPADIQTQGGGSYSVTATLLENIVKEAQKVLGATSMQVENMGTHFHAALSNGKDDHLEELLRLDCIIK